MISRQNEIIGYRWIIISIIILSLIGCSKKEYNEKKTMEKFLSPSNVQAFHEKKDDKNKILKGKSKTKTVKKMNGKVVFALKGIWIMNTDGTEPKRLTDNFLDQHPILSPDGKKIFYISEVMSSNEYVCEGGPMYAIWSMNTDGREKRRLLMKKAGKFYGITLLPNGKEILFGFAEDIHDGDSSIYIMDISERKLRKLTNSGNYYPSISLSDKKIVFDSIRDGLDSQIYIMNFDGTEQKRLTFMRCPSILPSFSPDSKKIVFVSWVAMGFEIFSMNTDGTNLRRLTYTPKCSEIDPSFSPNGKRILYLLEKDEDFEIWSIDQSGKKPVKLINLPEGREYLDIEKRCFGGYSFSPKGERIFFVLKEKGKFNLYTVTIDGREKRKVEKGENLPFNISLHQFRPGFVIVGKSVAEEMKKYEEGLKNDENND